MDDNAKIRTHYELSKLRIAKVPPLNLINYNEFMYLLLWQLTNVET